MDSSGCTVLVTGVAGFIGSHFARKWLNMNGSVIGVDNLNNYYDSSIKRNRIKTLISKHADKFTFYQINLNDKEGLTNLFIETIRTRKLSLSAILHFAAQVSESNSIRKINNFSFPSDNAHIMYFDTKKSGWGWIRRKVLS